VGEDGDQPGHAEDRADLARHVQDAAAGAETIRRQRRAARREQRRDRQAHARPAQQLGRQQVRQVRRMGLQPAQPEQYRRGVDQASDHRDPARPAEPGGQPGGDQACERQHHERPGPDGQARPDG